MNLNIDTVGARLWVYILVVYTPIFLAYVGCTLIEKQFNLLFPLPLLVLCIYTSIYRLKMDFILVVTLTPIILPLSEFLTYCILIVFIEESFFEIIGYIIVICIYLFAYGLLAAPLFYLWAKLVCYLLSLLMNTKNQSR
jgi:hypothetical protein